MTFVGIVLGGYVVILAVPLASVIVTLIDVVVRDKDPAKEHAVGHLPGERHRVAALPSRDSARVV